MRSFRVYDPSCALWRLGRGRWCGRLRLVQLLRWRLWVLWLRPKQGGIVDLLHVLRLEWRGVALLWGLLWLALLPVLCVLWRRVWRLQRGPRA